MTIAYGFLGLEHLFNTRVSEAGVSRVWTAVQESAAEHSRVVNGMLSTFVTVTEQAKEQIELGNSGMLQPLDEWGNPKPVKPSGKYDVAYPIHGGGTAWGDNRVSRALLTVEEANRNTVEAQNADANWLIYHILASLLDNTTWDFEDKAQGSMRGLGTITIQPLANGDAVTYNAIGGGASTDDHYMAQAGSIADGAATNPFPLIYANLKEHPSNSARPEVVTYVDPGLVDDIKGLANFVGVDDMNVDPGTSAARIVGEIDRGFGDDVIGRVDKNWIVEWSRLPANYMIAHATNGGPVVKWREYPAAELKGLFPENHSPDGNLNIQRLIRYGGPGVFNRVGAVVYQIGNATYQIPTGYETPLQTN